MPLIVPLTNWHLISDEGICRTSYNMYKGTLTQIDSTGRGGGIVGGGDEGGGLGDPVSPWSWIKKTSPLPVHTQCLV